MKTQSRVRRSLRRNIFGHLLDQLESRVLLSGNITASVSNGELYLQGNNLNNSVVVDQTSLSTTQFSVSSGDGTTTINGKLSPLIFSGVSGIAITIGSGNDTVVIQNATVADNVQVTGANGNQVITLNNVVIDGNFSLSNSGGQNSTTVENSTIDGNVTIDAGAGFNSQCGACWGCSNFSSANEIFTLSNSTVFNSVSLSNVSGETTTAIENSTVDNNLTVTNGASSYGNCSFNCCGGSSSPAGDLFTLNGSTIGSNVSISNASDGNTTDIENSSSIGGILAVSNVVGTSAQCGFNASCSCNLANASDAFTLSGGSTVTGNVTLANISDGATTVIDASSIYGSLTVTNGVGSYGQGFTSCCGQTSSNIGDLFTLSGGSYVNSNVSISNGSAYNCTTIDNSTLFGNVAISDGLNLAGQSGGNSCCGNSCGGGSSSVYTTDLFTLSGASTIIGSLSVSNASGYTNTTIEGGSTITNNVTITNANGVAYFAMSSSAIGGNLSFSAGSGTTTVAVANSTIGENATITAGSGTATVDVTNTTIDAVSVSSAVTLKVSPGATVVISP